MRRVGSQYGSERMRNLVKRSSGWKGKEWNFIERFHIPWTCPAFSSLVVPLTLRSSAFSFLPQLVLCCCCCSIPCLSHKSILPRLAGAGFCCLQLSNPGREIGAWNVDYNGLGRKKQTDSICKWGEWRYRPTKCSAFGHRAREWPSRNERRACPGTKVLIFPTTLPPGAKEQIIYYFRRSKKAWPNLCGSRQEVGLHVFCRRWCLSEVCRFCPRRSFEIFADAMACLGHLENNV